MDFLLPLSSITNMEKPSFKLVGAPCGQHGQYTFYKALRLTGERERIIAIGDFFFVRIWQDSELVSIGELQLLWTDRVSDQTLVSLRLYFLPENTPDGRNLHGEDEVLAINEKVVVKAEDLLSWVCAGAEWRYGLRAVWRGACAPPGGDGAASPPRTDPLHQTKLDFSDVDKEKSAIDGFAPVWLTAARRGAGAPPGPGVNGTGSPPRTEPLHLTKLDLSDVDKERSALEMDSQAPGVVVFSYPRYCRYRALVARLEGIQAAWLRDSLVAALGGYAAPTDNTRILYCKDTFEYPELEGHEFVCNHLAPRLKGRPRGRRRRAPRPAGREHSPSRSPSPSDPSSDSDAAPPPPQHRPIGPKTPRRLSLRNGAPDRQSGEDEDVKQEETPEDRAFVYQLKQFYKGRSEPLKLAHSLKDLSLRALYARVAARGGHAAVCRRRLWRAVHAARPAGARALYERFLLPFENHERRNGRNARPNGKFDDLKPIDTIELTDSPLREMPDAPEKPVKPEYRLRTPSPKPEDLKIKDVKEDINTTSKPAEELNREFLESLQNDEKPLKITLKPVEKLLEPGYNETSSISKLFEENSVLVAELAAKHSVMDSNKVIDEIGSRKLSEGSSMFLSELAQRLNLGAADTTFLKEIAKAQQELVTATSLTTLSSLGDKYAVNGHTPNGAEQKSARPVGRSSLRHVRVKPTRPAHTAANTPPNPPLRPDSASSSPPAAATRTPPAVTNFGIHHPAAPRAPHIPPAPSTNNSDDEIVEVPYRPKTPEIIDLDEYPESPQSQVKKKKLDILKERGLEVTAIPTATWGTVPPPVPLALGGINPPMMLNPAMQHQIMTQASLFQMYNIIPQNYANGIQPPKVIQATCIYGSSGPEKTVYGNPKDPFMPPPHILTGTPMKPQKIAAQPQEHRVQDILDLTCKVVAAPSQKPAVEIVRIPSSPSPSPSKPTAQNLSSKNYTVIDGKAVVGSNLEITLVNPKVTPTKNRPPQKRSSNGKFVSTKTPTPPKESPKPYASPSSVKKNPIVVPNYQINRDDVSPTSSTGSRDSQTNFLQNAYKNQQNVSQIMDMQKSVPTMTPFMDPLYMNALYNSLAGQMDHRQLAMYREFMANQFRGYSGLLGAATPTTKN